MAEESMKDFEKEIDASFKNSRRLDTEESMKWDKFIQMMEDKTVVRVKIIEVVKAGCVAYLDEVRGFIPASHLSTERVEDLDAYQNKNIDVVIITADPENKKLVMSHRDIERAQKDAARKERASQIKIGDVLTGKVDSIKDYGAFVDLGEGVDGLVHISQISHTRIKNPAAVLKVGQEVQVKVLDIKDGKISLSMKALIEAPGEFGESVEDPSEGFDYKETGVAATSLASLLKDIKLK